MPDNESTPPVPPATAALAPLDGATADTAAPAAGSPAAPADAFVDDGTDVLADFLAEHKIAPPDFAWRLLIDQLYDLLITANEGVNLTRIVDRNEYLIKHVADSLLVLAAVPELRKRDWRIADVGCGAGFPGLPLSLFCEESSFLEVDSVGKKIACVDTFIEALRLGNVEALHTNTREMINQKAHRRSYDFVLARAVGPTPRLIEESQFLLKARQARMIAFKTPNAVADERKDTKKAADKARMRIRESAIYHLPRGMGERQFVILTTI